MKFDYKQANNQSRIIDEKLMNIYLSSNEAFLSTTFPFTLYIPVIGAAVAQKVERVAL